MNTVGLAGWNTDRSTMNRAVLSFMVDAPDKVLWKMSNIPLVHNLHLDSSLSQSNTTQQTSGTSADNENVDVRSREIARVRHARGG